VEARIVRDPIYQQLNQELRRLLRGGGFASGAKFLTEREVGAKFAVSRATANKALSNLVSEGLLEFKKGVGTFVKSGGLDYDLQALVSFTDRAKAAGKKPETKILAREVIAAGGLPPAAARALGPGRAVYMERLRLADAVPVILERRWVATAHCPGLERAHLADSLYALWIGKYGLRLEGADQSIRAVGIVRGDARLLRVRAGAAALLVTSTGYLEGGEPLWFERTLYRGDAYEFQNRIGGLRSARPAIGALLTMGGA
jgi:GntR family transcriptional regulator